MLGIAAVKKHNISDDIPKMPQPQAQVVNKGIMLLFAVIINYTVVVKPHPDLL